VKRLLARRAKPDPDGKPASAKQLEAEGRLLDAIDALTGANREHRTTEIERQLVLIRHRAFEQVKKTAPPPLPQADASQAAPLDVQGVPSIAAEDLTADLIGGSILGRGCLLVRGLVGRGRAEQLVRGIDQVFEGRDAHAAGTAVTETTPWFDPFDAEPEYAPALIAERRFVNQGSGTWIADSPRLLFELLETFVAVGLRKTIAEYLGERPAISVNKGTLRRVPPTGGTEWWHQDGAFLGKGIRSLNVWLALSHCGRHAPGIEFVPQRLDHIVETGTRGADFDWSVGEEVVENVSGATIVRPIFEPGDALLFDHLLLHRTGTDPGMTESRYATETWFFAPSAYPDPHKQIPLVF
jgi:hypothetical protein